MHTWQWLALFLLAIVTGIPAHAGLAPGHYEVLDQIGAPEVIDENNPDVKRMREFMSHARKGGEIRLAQTDSINLVYPNYYKGGLQQQILDAAIGLVWESLMTPHPLGEDHTIYPALAESFDVLPDGDTYAIHLRKGIPFSDGHMLEAQDVVESWKFVHDEANGPALAGYYQTTYGDVKLEILSPLELQVRFENVPKNRQRNALFSFLSLSIVRKNPNPGPSFEIPDPYLGTGAYRVTSASRTRAILQRRNSYWDPKAPRFNFDRLTIEVIRDRTAEREAFKAHVIDFYLEPNVSEEGELDSLIGKSYFEKTLISKAFGAGKTFIPRIMYLNEARPNLNDLRFRKALALAMDLDYAIRVFFAGRYSYVATPGDQSPFQPHGKAQGDVQTLLQGSEMNEELALPYEEAGLKRIDGVKGRRERLLQATKLLREAGYQLKDSKLYKDGRRVVVSALMSSQSPTMRQILYYADSLRWLGIELNIHSVSDTSAIVAALHSGDYDMFPSNIEWPRKYNTMDAETLEYRLGSANAMRKFPKGTGLNASNLESATLDHILSEIRDTDPGTPRYHELNEALIRFVNANIPFIPLSELDTVAWYHGRDVCIPPNLDLVMQYSYLCP